MEYIFNKPNKLYEVSCSCVITFNSTDELKDIRNLRSKCIRPSVKKNSIVLDLSVKAKADKLESTIVNAIKAHPLTQGRDISPIVYISELRGYKFVAIGKAPETEHVYLNVIAPSNLSARKTIANHLGFGNKLKPTEKFDSYMKKKYIAWAFEPKIFSKSKYIPVDSSDKNLTQKELEKKYNGY